MISEVSIKQSVQEALKILKSFKLFKGVGTKPLGDHSFEFKKTSRKNRHIDIYNTALTNKDYEILLIEDSIFQFGVDQKTLRYAFIQNPNVFISKEDFLNL